MEHKNLSLDVDKNLVNKTLDDINMRYIILFLYIIRNDLFGDLKDNKIIESYERVITLDEIFKANIINFWKEDFVEIIIDLGLFKNIRSLKEFEQKNNDYILKMGDETITIEDKSIMTPADTLFTMINKKFKFLTRRNFNLALTKLKGVRCETTSIIHPFIFEIGENDYILSDDLYYILDQFGNIYQAIKMEVTIEGFYLRFNEISEKLEEFIAIFDPILNNKTTIEKVNIAIEENKDIVQYLKDEKINLSDKFKLDKIDKSAEIYREWNTKLIDLLNKRYKIKIIDKKLLKIKNYYSGKDKKFSYLEFIEKVSFNEDNIINEIKESLLTLRKDIVAINEEITKFTKKEIKLLNLDFEKYLISSDND
jgi:hypothetical protein